MDPVKRQTILREIEYWRNSKLLPEQYCDFLNNLYVDDETGLDSNNNRRLSIGTWKMWREIILIACLLFLFLVCYLYFTSFHPAMQISLSVLLIGLIYTIGLIKRKRKSVFAYIYIGFASILLLLIGEFLLRVNDWESALAVICTLFISGGVWIVIGLFARISLLHCCGWVYMIITYIMLIHLLQPDPKWYELYIYTLPVSVCVFLLGRHRLTMDRLNGWLFIAVAGLFLFIPEVNGFFIDYPQIPLIMGIVVKILCVSIIVWLLLRKMKTKVWVQQ